MIVRMVSTATTHSCALCVESPNSPTAADTAVSNDRVTQGIHVRDEYQMCKSSTEQ